MKMTAQSGMTLIEAMVAMTISSVLIIGSISMYSQARTNYRTTESVARMQENLRFSIDILDEDIRLAGYWGKASRASRFEGFADVTITCDGADVTNWALFNDGTRVQAIHALQDNDELPAGCKGTLPRDNSDFLIVRRAATQTNDPANIPNGVVQIQSSYGSGSFFDDNADPGSIAVNNKTFNQINNVEFSVYYVSERSKYDAELPALRRLTLTGNRIEDQELIPGVENLQVQFGVDSNNDSLIDMYVNGDEVGASTIISARLWMLVRAENNEAGIGYQDNRGPYETPDRTLANIDPQGNDAALYPPTYRRMAMSRTIMLRNTE